MACNFPFFVNDEPVPCGRCPNCLVRYVNGWVFRVNQELKVSDNAVWIRLSYDQYHVPRSPNGLMTLDYEDVRKFFKRLRRAHPVGHRTIKYFLCGEYGSRFHRPHYHVFIMNVDPSLIVPAWHIDGLPIGEVWFDDRDLNDACIAYTVGYTMKRKGLKLHFNDDRVSEFLRMSKKLGISYLSDAILHYHRSDVTRNFVTLPGGGKSALPRYFADKIHRPKVVQGYVCPVARLAYEYYLDDRSTALDPARNQLAQRAYDAHITAYGNADDFIRSQNAARLASIRNFQNRAKQRTDHV
ncbi:replication protein VP4 [Microviridae Fen7895_21]|uniref:replication protein VP4 n=1 Tax=Microviridae Fen7895_21 TaxID=1655660 RepID=UPI00063D58C4|nr:replication protein VP4 [Microviridae Fen7895_21]AKI26943.1 replication protein VP4 [Microviridae Fen7895_21]